MGAGVNATRQATGPAGRLRRPKLKTGLAPLRRGPSTVQFGLDPERAVLLTGIDATLTRCLDSLHGSTHPQDIAAALDIPWERVEDLLAHLADADLLEDGSVTPTGWNDLSLPSRDRLTPDLATLTQTLPGPDAGKQAFARRLTAHVEIRGGGRVGATLAGLLAAAGIGHVRVVDPASTTPADLAPGGLGPEALGHPRGTAATLAAARHAPERIRPTAPEPSPPTTPARTRPTTPARTRPTTPERIAPTDLTAPSLVVFADELPAVGAGDDLVRAGIPHLVAALRDTEGVVGPLVVPGHTSCLQCHHLTRADRDRAWPHLAAHLATGAAGRDVRAADVVLAAAVASHAGLQALAFLDTGTASTLDGTLHVRLPGGAVRRRSWRRHHACGCVWSAPT